MFERLVISTRQLCLLAALLASGCEVYDEPLPVAAPSPRAAPAAAVPEGGLHFVRGYETGLRVAQSEHRPMLVFFTAQWCHYCHEMADQVFTDPQVVALAQRFVCVQVDADSEARACEQLGVQAFPTVYLLSSQGVPLKRLVGKKEASQLAYEMRSTLQAIAQQSRPEGVLQR